MASRFNKRIKPSGDLAAFLDSNSVMTLEGFIRKMWDRLYETNSVVNLDGSPAQRKVKFRKK